MNDAWHKITSDRPAGGEYGRSAERAFTQPWWMGLWGVRRRHRANHAWAERERARLSGGRS